MLTHERLDSGASVLDLRVARPGARTNGAHVLVLAHGLPRAAGLGRQAAGLLPELATHLAQESGWVVATGTLSGVGGSTGTFSASQWRADLAAILDAVAGPEGAVSLAGFGFGGALALRAASDEERVRGVATFAAPAHLESWCAAAVEFHRLVQVAGVVGDPASLLGPEDLRADVLAVDPLAAITGVPPRRLLIGHGTEDPEIPASDARDLVDAAEGRAELRLIQGAGHQLRADPRMVATLLGWLDRHR
ncbi:MAG TPA: alpha/beta hydrolase [Acidimicrobiales bacterium]|nr:alpha/beta hydrolase [Acidimicrobiales bacterium]